MFYRASYVFDVEAGVELSELFVYELSTIVGYNRMWYAIDLLSCDGGQWFGFYLFGEVINGYY